MKKTTRIQSSVLRHSSREGGVAETPGRTTSFHFWLTLGAVFLQSMAARPAASDPELTEEQRSHWAFQPLSHPSVPLVADNGRIHNPIDAFIARRLESAGRSPNRRADRATLLRRVTLDLTGLPPTPEEIAAFLNNSSPGAYEACVDRLLQSPQHGERWARHWLDLARYAESEGFKADETRPNAWRYRDYVIRSLNNDKPYDRFVQEQIAGDELWPEDPEARIATAFNRHYPDESNARNLMQRRQEILNDITDTVGYVFLGLSYACARCHDHKWDPISQRDYYRLQAFFSNATATDSIELAAPAQRQEYTKQRDRWMRATADIRAELETIEAPVRESILRDYIEKYPAEIQNMLKKSDAERTAYERQMVAKANLYLDPHSHQFIAGPGPIGAALKGDQKARWSEIRAELRRHSDLLPQEPPIATGITEFTSEAPATHRLRRGNWNAPMEEVQPGFPSILGGGCIDVAPVAGKTSGRRTALAKMLTNPAHPLVARVLVNRVWHYHFGKGLVGTPSDFGLKGERPTHPELLDWLTADFIAHGWSLKHLHRQIVTSATYQQSAVVQETCCAETNLSGASAPDPENQLLWRFPRRRLEGETIRDAMLAVAGRLNPKLEGPSVFPELPQGMQTRGGWSVSEDPSERDRRSVYVFVRRNTRYPMFEAFDMPDTHESCPRRAITTSPIQALTLLNSELTMDWARSFARQIRERAGVDLEAQIGWAWRFAYSRPPQQDEVELALDFLRRESAACASGPVRENADSPATSSVSHQDSPDLVALSALCHALLNSNEFVYLN